MLICTALRFERYQRGDVIAERDERRFRRLYPYAVKDGGEVTADGGPDACGHSDDNGDEDQGEE